MDLNPICKAPNIIRGSNEISKRDITLSRWKTIKKRTLLHIESDENTLHTGLITMPFLLFEEEVYKTVSKYDPRMPSRQIILLDVKNNISCLYYLPILPRVDCISLKCELSNANTKFVDTPIIIYEKIRGNHIFWLEKFNSDLPVISLDLAESILRRNTMGIKLIPVELE